MKTKFKGILTLLLALVVQIAFAQQTQVSGTVTDNSGVPLPGVNIRVVGTDQGTQTDFNGQYSINVNQGDQLKFSFVGFTDQTITVGTQSTINVALKAGELLDQVLVSTGYETQTKAKSAKAVTTITAEDIQDRPNASAISSLQGKVAGLNIGSNSGQPGTSGTVILRGVGSINGNIEPLFVVDGIPTTKDNFTNINPNAIASISVLKGPNATSVYGNRGSNGVIVVTTKSGKYNSKMKINYRSQYGFSELMPLNLELMNAKQKLTFQRNNNIANSIGLGMTDQEIAAYAHGTNTYWTDYFFRTAQTNQQNLSITSGGENLRNATAINYMEQEGTFLASQLQRFGFRNKFSGKTSDDKFHYSTNIQMSFSKSDFSNDAGSRAIYFNSFLNAMQGSPLLSPFDPDGSVTIDGGLIPGDPASIKPFYAPIVLLNSTHYNTQREEQLNILGGLHADWNFISHFTAGVDVNVNYTTYRNTNITSPLSLLGPFQVDQRAEYGGIQGESYTRDARFTVRTNLNYNNTFGIDNKHSVNVNLYTEYHKNHYYGMGYSTRGLDPKLIGTSNAFNLLTREDLDGDGVLDYPYAERTSLSLSNVSTGLFSYFATADYDYDDRFGLQASIRRDASLRFIDDNKWGTFWSVAGRWNIDKEAWMEDSAFNLLKLRAGYGTSGNQSIAGGFYGGLDLFRNLYTGGNGYNGTNSYVAATIANPSLRWETTKTLNIGVDFGVWKNRLNGKLDIYEKKTTDLYQSRPVSLVFATSSINANVGSLRNRGIELALEYTIFNNLDWDIKVYGNASYNKNEILELPGADENGSIRDGSTGTLTEGQSIGEYFVAKYAGVNPANGHALFYDINGNLTEQLRDADRVYTGDYQVFPEIQGGFGAIISYKGFSLAQDWVFFANVDRLNLDLADLEGSANYINYNSAASLLRAWKQPGDITDIPGLYPSISTIDHINGDDRYIQDASYLRLRNVSLGYTFSKDLLQGLPVNSIKIYAQAENLLTFTKFEGFDPQSSYTGIESSRYPSAKTYTIGLNVSF